jgi:hypothetical protein
MQKILEGRRFLNMSSPELTADVLLNIGFVDVGKWCPSGDVIDYKLDGENAKANKALLHANNALYAFVEGDQVRYLGKTARSIRNRFLGYCRPGKDQKTNLRCHSRIRCALSEGNEIRIFAFVPITHLRYAEFEINLAAGLEDDLIRQFDPPWNGKDNRGQETITENAEREEAEEAQVANTYPVASSNLQEELMASYPTEKTFSIVLRPTYFYKGFLNIGIEASKLLGKDGELIRVLLDDASVAVISKINRTANKTGAVRVVGGNRQIAQWFQENFKEGDTLQGRIIDRHTICLLPRIPAAGI